MAKLISTTSATRFGLPLCRMTKAWAAAAAVADFDRRIESIETKLPLMLSPCSADGRRDAWRFRRVLGAALSQVRQARRVT